METNAATQTINVLLVEDDAADRRLIKLLLAQGAGLVRFNVEMAEALHEATNRLSHGDYGVILLDLGLPDSQGLDTLRALRSANSRIPIVVLTGLSDEQTGLAAIQEGAEDYLIKGQSLGYVLARTVCYAIERKHAEEGQMRLLEELEDANRELWDFVHTVSHDLKMPLRRLKTLADYLMSDYGDEVDENGRMQFTQLQGRLTRMNELIDDVLRSTSTGRPRKEQGQVDMHELVQEVISMLAPPESLTIKVRDRLPVVKGELPRIAQVLQSLLSSAIKRMDKPHGEIEVTCEESDGFWRFGVSDNGPGMEKARLERALQLSLTPTPHNPAEHGGIGLPLAKKIIESCGGTIWVESEVAQGNTFFFTLPRQQAEIPCANLEANIAH